MNIDLTKYPTPRTEDRAACSATGNWVGIEFSRTLERENAALREVLDDLIKQCDETDWIGGASEMYEKLDAARAILAATEPKE